jgi:M6 family metalloprotease-like protein
MSPLCVLGALGGASDPQLFNSSTPQLLNSLLCGLCGWFGVRRSAFIVLCALCVAPVFAAELAIARAPHALMPREGEAINKLITHRTKVHYRSEPNRSFTPRSSPLATRHLPLDRVDTIKVLALRVEFQEDNSPLTTGNGRMDYAGFLTPDAGLFYDPPHTRNYFMSLMTALQNYYALNSLGHCYVKSRVMPLGITDAYQLPHDMLYYGDTISMEGVETGLTRLMRDAIKVADADPAIRFSDYDLLVIFHAGSTAQTDLRYDSPFDLFTGTLGERALQSYLGEPFVLADEGRTRVTAATILPEMARQDTIYQGETNILGMTGIEGLLYHEFNHLLGGYDLYDITYNSMGVGAWSIMGYGGWLGDWGLGVPPGTIPSLLDPWHKVHYGWVKPRTVRLPIESIPLFAAEMDTSRYQRASDTMHPTIVKVPITPTEYFLIENRQAEVAHKDTLIVHVEDGVPVTVFDGEYDFFLPGSGVLIWHIDESVIDRFGPDINAINIDPQHKGVDLVEGDGIQDFDGWSGMSSFDYQIYGSKNDPYYVGGYNDSLAPATIPNSDGYTGKTFVTVAVNSAPDTLMPTSVSFDLYQPGFPVDPGRAMPYNPATLADIAQNGSYQFVVSDTGGRISAWNSDGTTFLPGRTNGSFVQLPGTATHSAVTVGDIAGDNHQEIIASTDNGRVYAYTSTAGTVPGFPVITPDRITATPVLADLDSDGKKEIIAGSTDGNLYVWRGNGDAYPGFPARLGSELRSAVALTDRDNPQLAVLASDGKLFLINPDGTIAPGFPLQVGTGSLYTYAAPVVADLDRDGNKEITCVASGGYDYQVTVVGLDGELAHPQVKARSRAEIRNPFLGTPCLSDVNGDGYLDIVLAAKNAIYAFDRNGILISNYPFEQESSYVTTEIVEIAGSLWLFTFDNPFLFSSSPVIADINADGTLEIIIGAPQYGVRMFNSRTGKQDNLSPLATLSGVSTTPLISDADRDGRIELAVGSDDGIFHVWKMPDALTPDPQSLLPWGSYLKDSDHSGLYTDDQLPEIPAPRSFIADKFYVYPNPAEKTAIPRYTLGNVTNATAKIQILDVSGLPLSELPLRANPMSDNESPQPINLTGIPSGIYLVRLEVNSDQGKVVKFYKLAVVR